jgi:hypothetical protein
MAGPLGAEHYGQERRETAQEKAERIIHEVLGRRRGSEAALGKRAKGERMKVTLAAKLRAETTVTEKWIAQRLAMGTAG